MCVGFIFFWWNLISFQFYFAQVPVILLGLLYTLLLSWLICKRSNFNNLLLSGLKSVLWCCVHLCPSSVMIICVHQGSQVLHSYSELQMFGLLCTWMLNFPFHHPFLRRSPSTFSCLCSLQPTLPAHLLCHRTVNEHIWHGPWFATRVSSPTHILATAFWHVKTCFIQSLSREPVLI